MPEPSLPGEASLALENIGKADIVVGIPSYNNAPTITHVVRAAQAGLARYYPRYSSVIVNSDGGSKDGTRDAVLSAHIEAPHLLMLSTPMHPVHRLSFPYHGIPGKGSAFRLIFEIARKLNAKGCAVVDSDLRSITPEWFDLLLRPVVEGGFDFVAPYYFRHKYDGTITNSIVYPLTRALYGHRVRQPIGGEFGVSAKLISRYLERDDWETDVARFGIDIWMSTIALAEGFRTCQSFLGAKLHDAKDPAADLSAMLQQVVGSVFTLMAEYAPVWRGRSGSEPVDVFGFQFDVGLDPIEVNTRRMLDAFAHGAADLADIWSMALSSETRSDVRTLATQTADDSFHIPDELWARIVMEFACAHHDLPLERGHLLRSLTPLYLARVASFVIETRESDAAQVEERIERLCLCFEEMKPQLISGWDADRKKVSPEKRKTKSQPADSKREV